MSALFFLWRILAPFRLLLSVVRAVRFVFRRFVLVMAFLSTGLLAGCLQPVTQPPIQKQGVKKTWSVPKVKPEASEDGFKFTTPHFILQYDKTIVTKRGYATPDERISRGLGAMLSLESQYNFLKEVLGIEPPAIVTINVVPGIQGNENDAFTGTGWRTRPDGTIEYQIQESFGVEAFADPSIRAHEMTHAFTAVYGIPAWLSEGIAVLVERELAGGALWAAQRRGLKSLGETPDGYNVIQVWRHPDYAGLPFRSVETYAYSYSVVSELRNRFGDPFFQRFWQSLRQRAMEGVVQRHSDAQIVRFMSDAAGQDLSPFFVNELGWKLELSAAASSPVTPKRPANTPPGEIPPLQ